ncbi:MAG: hypothetical protein QOF20_2901 [Acidimicrobiaceae bacterium]|nr:hypothetical protein [Acidimicrobiaceae bacterium]
MSHETGREPDNLAISKLAGLVGRRLGRRRKGQAPDAAVGTIVGPWPELVPRMQPGGTSFEKRACSPVLEPLGQPAGVVYGVA